MKKGEKKPNFYTFLTITIQKMSNSSPQYVFAHLSKD